MPKIVPDIQNTILNAAESHFREYGFEDADMRKIASDAKIAVGTIYLHYQNKETLYLKVIEYRWKVIIEKIELLLKQDINPKEVLKQVLLELAHEMTRCRSTWMEVGFMHHHHEIDMDTNRHFSGPHDPISKHISTVLLRITEKNQTAITEQTLIQLGSLAFIMTVDSCMQESGSIDKRIDLIVDLLDSYLR